MKCPICDGGGRITSLPSGMPVKCTRCNGTGEVEQTNEEWRKNCSTEDFADFLAGVAHAGAYEARNCNTNGMLQTQNTDFWLAWLKEKHNEM